MSILKNRVPPAKYLRSKRPINFLRTYCHCKKATARLIVDQILENLNDPHYVLGVDVDGVIVRCFWNTPTQSLAVGVGDDNGGMVVFDL